MKSSYWLAGLAFTGLVAAGAAGWLWQGAAPETRYRTAAIDRGTLKAVVAASGTVNPVSQVQVSSQVSGQIREVLVDFNSEVRQGQLIARLDPQTFEYRVRQAQADVEAARASVLTAQAQVQQVLAQVARARVALREGEQDLARKRDLVRQSFISPAEADTAEFRRDTLAEEARAIEAQLAVTRAQAVNAQAIVRQRDAARAQAEVDLQRTQIRSPVDGVVIRRSVEVGQTVAVSLQAPELFTIARNLSDMQVEVSIDEADVARVRAGLPVEFTIDALPGEVFRGTVRQVRKASVLQQNVVTYVVVVDFSNPGARLLPGMTANVRVVTDTREAALRVPNAALRMRIPGLEPVAEAGDAPAGMGHAGHAGAIRVAAASAVPLALAEEAAADDAVPARSGTPGRLYTLDEQGRPIVHAVRLGIAEGTQTELLAGPGAGGAGALREGTRVIVGLEARRGAAEPTGLARMLP